MVVLKYLYLSQYYSQKACTYWKTWTEKTPSVATIFKSESKKSSL